MVSSPLPPPFSVSLPVPPSSWLATSLPVMESSKSPPITFSMLTSVSVLPGLPSPPLAVPAFPR